MGDWVKPDSGSKGDVEFFNLKRNEGSLLGIKVKRFQEDYENNFKEIKDAVFADITVFDGDNAGKVFDNANVEAVALVNILKDHVGSKVLGRLVKATGKSGGKYWNLEDPTDEDFALASAGAAKKSGPFG